MNLILSEDLVKMKPGEMIRPVGDTNLREIHRTLVGWIYFFKSETGHTSSTFIPEVIHLN